MNNNTILLPLSLALLATAACGGSTTSNNPNEGQDSGMAADTGAVLDSGGAVTDSGVGGDTGSGVVDSGPMGVDGGKFVAVPLDMCGPALQYTATATIGGSQQFQLAVDTGSGSLGVAGSTCSNCGVSPEYTPDSTAIDEMQVCMAAYGSGSWNGEIYQDNVALGPSMAVPVKFGAMTDQTSFLQPAQTECVAHPSGGGNQGIVGFGPAASSFPGTDGFWDVYSPTEMVPNLFAMKLCDTSGTLYLGGFDGNAVTAPPKFTPMVGGTLASTYYLIDFETITVGTGGTAIAVGNGRPSLVDTGTSIFILATAAYDSVLAALNANPAVSSTLGSSFLTNGGCEAVQQSKAQLDAMLPPLTLTFGTGASAITINAAPTDSYIYFAGNQDWCVGITGGNVGAGAILGAPILKSNVVIWDRANSQIGFAPKSPCP